VAVIGAGVSGLAAARRLRDRVRLTVYEARDRPGGHARTVEVTPGDRTLPVDTGFIVYNSDNYPLFSALLDELGIESRPTTMGFSYSWPAGNLEYSGESVPRLFVQPRNLLRPWFWRMLRDILHFYATASEEVPGRGGPSLDTFVRREGYSGAFVRHHLYPMAASIWSTPEEDIGSFPVGDLVAFFQNHGLMNLWNRPRWRTVAGGSRRYVRAMVEPFRDRLRLNTPVESVRRDSGGVRVATADGVEAHDAVVMAVHADRVLDLLEDPTPRERKVLGSFEYASNPMALHTDRSLLPERSRAWAAWNYRRLDEESCRDPLTYCMNVLQDFETPEPICVTVNPPPTIDRSRVIDRWTFTHPLYTRASSRARRRYDRINGTGGVYYAGAYWGFGFHEDGLRSGYRAAASLGVPSRS